jgi:hypothetical protein
MRVKRSIALPEEAAFHYLWRCVDKAFFLTLAFYKAMFLDSFFKFHKRSMGMVAAYSYCVMSNHFHMVAELLGGPDWMSKWAHSGHTSFSVKFNRREERIGPVGADRFKSVVIEDDESIMYTMFYGDWNPVAAGMVSHPREYEYSSYRFYAYGEVNRWTEYLTRPKWYMDLADTDEERQRLYREMAELWWVKHGKSKTHSNKRKLDYAPAFGSKAFANERVVLISALVRAEKRGMEYRDDVIEMMERVMHRPTNRESPVVVSHKVKWRGATEWEPPEA